MVASSTVSSCIGFAALGLGVTTGGDGGAASSRTGGFTVSAGCVMVVSAGAGGTAALEKNFPTKGASAKAATMAMNSKPENSGPWLCRAFFTSAADWYRRQGRASQHFLDTRR